MKTNELRLVAVLWHDQTISAKNLFFHTWDRSFYEGS